MPFYLLYTDVELRSDQSQQPQAREEITHMVSILPYGAVLCDLSLYLSVCYTHRHSIGWNTMRWHIIFNFAIIRRCTEGNPMR
jgi:hypothetical protein